MNVCIKGDIDCLMEKGTLEIEKLRNKKILLLGSTGMILSYMGMFLAKLNKQYELNIVLYLHGRNLEKIRRIYGSIIDRKNVFDICFDLTKEFPIDINVDYIIHGASPAGTKMFLEKPVETIISNVYGVKNSLDYARIYGSKVCFLSSTAIYGNTNKCRIAENDYGIVDPLDERACYMESKRLAEQLCYAYNKEYGIKAYIARIPYTYGPTYDLKNDVRALPKFIKSIIENRNIELFDDSVELQYTYVADIVTAILYILHNGVSGEAYNVCGTNCMNMQEILEKLLIYTDGKSCSKIILKKKDKNYYFGDKTSINLIAMDNRKLENLGWKECCPFSFGLRQTISGIYERLVSK